MSLATDVLLQGDDCVPYLEEAAPLAPPPDVFLDGDTRPPQPVQAQLLQVRHLTGTEEDLGAAKLVLLRVLQRTGRVRPQQV